MYRVSLLFVLLCSVGATPQSTAVSDPVAISLARQAIATLTGGAAISDVTMNAQISAVLSPNTESGTGVFRIKGTGETRIDLTLDNGDTRSEVRGIANGSLSGSWKKNNDTPVAYAAHNCWSDASWFFPGLSSLTQTQNPNFIFKYVGKEQHGGVSTQHIRVYQISSVSLLQHLSTIDFYLDPASTFPLAVAFQVHPDKDASRDIPAEVRFANYQSMNGILVPFRIQQMLNGGVVLDVKVTSAVLNSGLPDSIFSLQ